MPRSAPCVAWRWGGRRGCSPAPIAAVSAAFICALIRTARLNDIDPQAWVAYVLARIADLPQTRLHELLPWNLRSAELALKSA